MTVSGGTASSVTIYLMESLDLLGNFCPSDFLPVNGSAERDHQLPRLKKSFQLFKELLQVCKNMVPRFVFPDILLGFWERVKVPLNENAAKRLPTSTECNEAIPWVLSLFFVRVFGTCGASSPPQSILPDGRLSQSPARAPVPFSGPVTQGFLR